MNKHGARLIFRSRVCGCTQFLELSPENCQLLPIVEKEAATSPLFSVVDIAPSRRDQS